MSSRKSVNPGGVSRSRRDGMEQRVPPNIHEALSPFFSDYEPIVRLLQQVKGPVSVQKYIIQHAIKEAVRYET